MSRPGVPLPAFRPAYRRSPAWPTALDPWATALDRRIAGSGNCAQVTAHHGDTESTEAARRTTFFSVFTTTVLSPCNLRVLRVSVVRSCGAQLRCAVAVRSCGAQLRCAV